MRQALLAATVLAFCAGAASAQPAKPLTRSICIDVGGQSLPAVCKRSGSRFDKVEDICICPQGRRVDVPVCRPGETPPGESLAFEKFRRDASRDGSLVGDAYQNKPICIAPLEP